MYVLITEISRLCNHFCTDLLQEVRRLWSAFSSLERFSMDTGRKITLFSLCHVFIHIQIVQVLDKCEEFDILT